MALEKNKKDYLKPPAHLQQWGRAHRLLSTRLYQEGVSARALKIKINIKMENCISEQADHDLWSRSIFPAPVLGSNVPSQVPISKLGLC